jgi:BirA family biotin operon repressor/biotin-[acetyl-CoA-carboxylase] ligase
MPQPYSSLERPPLNEAALRRALVRQGSVWTEVRVVAETGSTNVDVAAAAQAGAREGLVLVTEYQAAGRGRMGRGWASPPYAGLTFSLLVRPNGVPTARRGWLPLLAGVTVVEALRTLAEIDAGLKWPNDVLSEGRKKVCGILAETVGDAVVVGIGLNVTTRRGELPPDRPDSSSLALEGAACLDREPLLKAVLRGFAARYEGWREAGGDPEASGLRAAYLERCTTLGQPIRAVLPGGGEITGTASDVDGDGRLVITTADGEEALAAGDVHHLRPAS